MSDEIKIRLATADDAQAISRIYAWYVTHTAITFEYDAPDEEEMRRRITNTLKAYPYFVAEKEGIVMGYAYAGPFHPRVAYAHGAELSIYLKKDIQGLGVGKQLYQCLEDVLRLQNVCNVYACIARVDRANDPYLTNSSIAFHANIGFKEVALFEKCGYKFSRWYDMVWMGKNIGEHLPEMPPFVPFQQSMLKINK